MTDLASRLVTLLSDGRWRKLESARGSDLCSLLQAERRSVEAAIQEARLAGHPIVGSSLRGVRLSDDPAEIDQYVADRRERLVTIYLGSRALRRTARRMRESADLTLFGDAA